MVLLQFFKGFPQVRIISVSLLIVLIVFICHVIVKSDPFICGDTNDDGRVNVADINYLINYVFWNGPPPYQYYTGDVDGDWDIDVGDIVYLYNTMFKFGPPLNCQLKQQPEGNPGGGE